MVRRLTFAGPGEMRARCRALDWSATPLGPIETWRPALRTAVQLCLDSGFPTVVHAGPEKVLIYNDHYMRALGGGFAQDPGALGRNAREIWPNVWDQLSAIYASLYAGGPAQVFEDRPYGDKDGRKEITYWTSSLSAIRDDDGAVLGIYCQGIQTTSRVHAQASGANDDTARPDRKLSSATSDLTPRETDALRLGALGHSNKEIAAALGVSVKTVETHKANGMAKLGVANRAALVRFAMGVGWLENE